VYIFLILVVFARTPLSTIFTPPAPNALRIAIDNAIKKFIPLMEEDSRVWVIVQNTSGYEDHITRYLMAPRTAQGSANDYRWSLGEPYSEGDIWTYNITPENWREEIIKMNYNYILVESADTKFWNTYGNLFCGEDQAINPQLFKVESGCFTRINP
jgi:hypothetical protein